MRDKWKYINAKITNHKPTKNRKTRNIKTPWPLISLSLQVVASLGFGSSLSLSRFMDRADYGHSPIDL